MVSISSLISACVKIHLLGLQSGTAAGLPKRNQHGGTREGSGRPAGAVNKATSELKLNLSELAWQHNSQIM